MQRMLMQIIDKKKLSDTDGNFWPGSSLLDGYCRYWSELRAFSQDIVQDFSGSGSAQIAAATGRVALHDVSIEKSVDIMSPFIFEYCCSGQAVDTVAIDVWADTKIRMTLILDGGVNFSGYKISGERYFPPVLDNVYNLDVPALSDGGRVTGVTRQQKPGYTVTTKEVFKLWFTRATLAFEPTVASASVAPNGVGGRAWDGGKNCPDTAGVGSVQFKSKTEGQNTLTCRFYKLTQTDPAVTTPSGWA